jgi:transcriptional regulator with XRE-family HTH domain
MKNALSGTPLSVYLAARRQKLGLTQKDLAEAAGYSVQAISRFEKGETQISLASLPAICNLLHLSLSDLFLRSETPYPPAKPLEKINPDVLASSLKNLRGKAHYSRNKEAQLLGVSPKTIFNYEAGFSLPALDVMDRILVLYSLMIEDLVYPLVVGSLLPYESPRKKRLALLFILLGALLLGAGGGTGAYFGIKEAMKRQPNPISSSSSVSLSIKEANPISDKADDILMKGNIR